MEEKARSAEGELYFRMGRYDNAEKMLTKGVSIRGISFDAVVARENLAQVYEFKREFGSSQRDQDLAS